MPTAARWTFDMGALSCTARPRAAGKRPGALAKTARARRCQERGPQPCRAMERRQVADSDLRVSKICLGTMLFGEQHTYQESTELMSAAVDGGINFFDTAEMYPVPQRAETSGRSEEFVGRWLKGQKRDQLVIATKVSGPSGQMEWIRGGPTCLDSSNIMRAIEGSLQRLGVDYIDLYQVHWPDRYVPMFGETDFDPSMDYLAVPLEEQLEALGKAVSQGKIRHIGLSNETPWGLAKCAHLATHRPDLYPKPVTIQNAYRTFDSGLAEVCHQEGIALLAYSPLAMGLLTGKYLGGAGPPEARLNRYKGRYAEAESRYGPRPRVAEAVGRYAAAAWRAGMSPLELALRFVLQHPLVASAVTGATSRQQLREIIAAASRSELSKDTTQEINAIHCDLPNPTP